MPWARSPEPRRPLSPLMRTSMLPSLGFSRPKDIELKYFDFAGAAEKVRFTLLMGGVPFKDTRVNFADWGKMKETTKFGQLPLMYLNGEEKPYAQSGAMLFGSPEQSPV